mgnify:CR=1 FL=1
MGDTLANDLLNDLDDLGDSDSEEEGPLVGPVSITGVEDEGRGDEEPSAKRQRHGVISRELDEVLVLHESKDFAELMRVIAAKLNEDDASATSSSSLAKLCTPVNFEQNEDYRLMVRSNSWIEQIDEEFMRVAASVALIYRSKFAELETLVPNKEEYLRCVRRIGNEMDMTAVELDDILPANLRMIVSVTGSTTSGVPLNQADAAAVQRGCEEGLNLVSSKHTILRFVESRMGIFAPNVSAIVGVAVSAQLISLAGGVVALSRIPSSNLQVVGQIKGKQLAGFSRAASGGQPHTGVIYDCDLVQGCPPDMRRKMLKVVSAKVALAARVDAYRTTTGGEEGKRLREELEQKIEKLQEPDQGRTHKALPIPEEKRKQRRGGKRFRKMKERMAISEQAKERNRLAMGTGRDDEEYGDSAMGLDKGMLGAAGSGQVRGPTEKKLSFQNRKSKKALTASAGGQTDGLSTSLIFTPVQGMELADPNAVKKKVAEANSKWFGANSGFASAMPKG